jgi:hypothetical protein
MIAAEPPELGKWLREDARAFSAQRRALPASAKVTVAVAPKVTTVGEPAKPATPGWSEALQLKTPHVDLVDRVAEGFAKQDRAEAAFRRKLK